MITYRVLPFGRRGLLCDWCALKRREVVGAQKRSCKEAKAKAKGRVRKKSSM